MYLQVQVVWYDGNSPSELWLDTRDMDSHPLSHRMGATVGPERLPVGEGTSEILWILI